jgi:hypothetical protein
MTQDMPMELDDLKLAWQSLDQRLEMQNKLSWQQLKDTKMAKARARLRPLYWGQVAQALAGILVILLSVEVWTRDGQAAHLLIAGLITHVYGVLMIIFAGRTLWLIRRIDYAAPVVTIQHHLAELRRFYVVGGLVIGLAWWFLWMPFMMVLVAWLGADLYRNAPAVIYYGLAIGTTGLLVTWLFHVWSQNPSRPDRAKSVADSLTGGSLRRAQAVLDEVRQFERE